MDQQNYYPNSRGHYVDHSSHSLFPSELQLFKEETEEDKNFHHKILLFFQHKNKNKNDEQKKERHK